jgi:hypothetical protein
VFISTDPSGGGDHFRRRRNLWEDAALSAAGEGLEEVPDRPGGGRGRSAAEESGRILWPGSLRFGETPEVGRRAPSRRQKEGLPGGAAGGSPWGGTASLEAAVPAGGAGALEVARPVPAGEERWSAGFLCESCVLVGCDPVKKKIHATSFSGPFSTGSGLYKNENV